VVGEGRVEGRERRHISLNAHLEKTRRKDKEREENLEGRREDVHCDSLLLC